jgi:heme-degrading monooxygenase HmoA
LVYWQDHETMAAWRNHPRHRIAQQSGRSKWYASFRLEVADIVRETKFER